MKKIFLLAALVVIGLSACEGPMGPMGPEGPPGSEGQPGAPGHGSNWFVTAFTVNESDWILSGAPNELNSYYYADKALPELTESIFEEGGIIAYLETDENVKNGMPFVLHKGGEDANGEFLWTQTYDFDFSPGYVRFYVTYSDFITAVPPGTEKFHVVLMW